MIAECAQGRVEARQEGQAGRRTQERGWKEQRQRASLKRRSWESVIRTNSGGGFGPLVLHDRGAEGREALNGLNPLCEEARRISVLRDQFALAIGKARMNVVSNVFRHHAFADDLLDLSLDVAIAARRLQCILQSRTPHTNRRRSHGAQASTGCEAQLRRKDRTSDCFLLLRDRSRK